MAELTTEVKTVRDEIVSALGAYKEQINKELDQIKTKGFSDPETKEAIEKVVKRIDELETEYRRPAGNQQPILAKTIGQVFVESDRCKSFIERGWHKGYAAIPFTQSLFERKTTITSSAVGSSTPGILVPERQAGIVTPALERLQIRDLLAKGTTTNNAVEYVKENVFTNAASPQAEAGNKAESALTFTILSANVRTIAHWIPATRQVLEDMGELMSYIDFRLMYGLKEKEETEILFGDNLGDHLNGLCTQAAAYNTAYNVASDTKIDKLRHAIKQARLSNYPVDGIVVNPADWEAIELVKTEEGGANKGMYILGGPGQVAARTLWSIPVVETNNMTAGRFLVGAFGMGAKLFDRQQAVIDVSTEHSDYFIKNMVAVRAEERVALAVYRTTAFVFGAY
jgi:HK97 family phage major capsid protein